jgi:hypothetical protein
MIRIIDVSEKLAAYTFTVFLAEITGYNTVLKYYGSQTFRRNLLRPSSRVSFGVF